MLYRTFQGEKLSLLGFGTMRLPTLPSGEVDEQTTRHMVKLALDSGVNYFDTAYPYHSGASERVIGRALAGYPRESFYLATKYPGHQVKQSYDPAAVFEEQLKKCSVGERNPSARFAGTSPFRGGFWGGGSSFKRFHAQSAHFTRRTFPPPSTGPR